VKDSRHQPLDQRAKKKGPGIANDTWSSYGVHERAGVIAFADTVFAHKAAVQADLANVPKLRPSGSWFESCVNPSQRMDEEVTRELRKRFAGFLQNRLSV
jgi:hypothetical protein